MIKEIHKPVLFMVFNRPEKTRRVWEQIRIAKPQKLYISADAPRINFPDDKKKCEEVRNIVENVDWDCQVKRLYHDKNLGCTLAGKTAFDWVFSQEKEMIQLEDDVLPTQSFFWFMQEMLERYKENPKICYICAENYGIKFGEATYFFSKYGGSWGWATWKRVYDLWEYKLDSLEQTINTHEFRKSFPSRFQYHYWKKRFFYWKYIGGNTYDLQTIYLLHKYDMLNIVPNVNLITNIGWDQEASNTIASDGETEQAEKFGNIAAQEIDEIIHPELIKSDAKTDVKWFKHHFQARSELEYWIRWSLGPYYRKIKKLVSG